MAKWWRAMKASVNPAMTTGEIEVRVTDAEVLGPTEPLPFNVFPETPVPEDLRLTYRFLDLRRSKMHANILLRSQRHFEHPAAHGGARVHGISRRRR